MVGLGYMELNDGMQRQARALADQSRFQLFRYIVDSDGPCHVAELTKLLGFNHNAIRQHLAVLVDAGLVHESTERRTTRGRPRKEYVVREDALASFPSAPGSFHRLSELLLELVKDGDPFEVGKSAGELDARKMRVDLEAPAAAQVMQHLGVQGFEPSVTDDGSIVLGNCPFADIAQKNQEVVCELHRGLINGVLATREGHRADLVVKDPHAAGCQVHLHAPSDC